MVPWYQLPYSATRLGKESHIRVCDRRVTDVAACQSRKNAYVKALSEQLIGNLCGSIRRKRVVLRQQKVGKEFPAQYLRIVGCSSLETYARAIVGAKDVGQRHGEAQADAGRQRRTRDVKAKLKICS